MHKTEIPVLVLEEVEPVLRLAVMSEVRRNFMVIQAFLKTPRGLVESLWELCRGSGRLGEDWGSERGDKNRYRMTSLTPVLLLLAFASTSAKSEYLKMIWVKVCFNICFLNYLSQHDGSG